MTINYLALPSSQLTGRLQVPGDKSVSHRSIMLGSIAEGTTKVTGFLEGEDALSTIAAFRAMGVIIDGPRNGEVTVHGVGLRGLQAPKQTLDLGNSGTSMRLLAGLLAGQAFSSQLIGDSSLMKRPMERVAGPLRKMGAHIETAENGRPPLKINPVARLSGIAYESPVASAQVKSALLLAGLYAQGKTCVSEPGVTRDHTERMLDAFGYTVERNNNTVCLTGGGKLAATDIQVPADISSAAFFMVGASIAPDSDVVLSNVGINPTRTGVIDILKLMGANLELLNQRKVGGEPIADIRIKHARLRGIEIPRHLVPLAIDEFPAIFIAAACADGETVLSGAEELRVKESDRLQVMADGLQSLGVNVATTPDGLRMRGGSYGGGEIDSHGDHRIAMAFAMAALRASKPIEILNCANVATSFPNFVELAKQAGLSIQVNNA